MYTVLVIDDDDELRQEIAIGLRRKGFAVLEAAHGKEALNYCNQLKFDLLLLDEKMPQMSGSELVLALQANRSEAPIILMSGHGRSEDYSSLRLAKFLGKPFGMDELVNAIEEVRQHEQG